MNFNVGDKFSSAVSPITQENINRFGNLHGTNGRTHTDPEYANQSAFGGVIVQGALVMAPIFNICDELFSDVASKTIEIEAKFIGYTRPGDAVAVEITVTKVQAQGVALEYACNLPSGKKVQAGTIVMSRATQ